MCVCVGGWVGGGSMYMLVYNESSYTYIYIRIVSAGYMYMYTDIRQFVCMYM